MNKNQEIGRILRASTTGFAVGCRVGQLSVPAFDGLVQAQPVDDRECIYGLIYNMNIDDDPVVQRLVMAESPPTPVIEDQRRNRLLPIEMSVLAVGYRLGDELRNTELHSIVTPLFGHSAQDPLPSPLKAVTEVPRFIDAVARIFGRTRR